MRAKCEHCGVDLEADFQDKVLVHGEYFDLHRYMQCKQCHWVNVVVYHFSSVISAYEGD